MNLLFRILNNFISKTLICELNENPIICSTLNQMLWCSCWKSWKELLGWWDSRCWGVQPSAFPAHVWKWWALKLSPSKCFPQRIEELSVKDCLPQSCVLSFSDLILQTTLAKPNGSTGCDEPKLCVSLSRRGSLSLYLFTSSSYVSKIGPIDWLKTSNSWRAAVMIM